MPKTTISLSETVQGWADSLAKEDGFDNFSAFIADLIRRRKEKFEAEKREGAGITSYLPNDKGNPKDKNATGGTPAPNSSLAGKGGIDPAKIPMGPSILARDKAMREEVAAARKNRRISKRRPAGGHPPPSGTKIKKHPPEPNS